MYEQQRETKNKAGILILLNIKMLGKPMQEVDNFNYIRERNQVLLEFTHFAHFWKESTCLLHREEKACLVQFSLNSICPSLGKNGPMSVV